MSQDRIYTCLACDDRPTFYGKLDAALHLRMSHGDLLEERHPDELLAEGAVFQRSARSTAHSGPYICVCSKGDEIECGEKRIQEHEMERHVATFHSIGDYHVRYGEHYLSELDYSEREVVAKREQKWLIDQACDRFFLTMQSVRGCSDFLTECGA